MASIYDRFDVRADLAQDGVWHDFGDGRRMRIGYAHASNPRYARALQAIQRRNKHLIDESGDPAVLRGFLIEAYAASVITGLEGSWERDGVTATAFSRESVVRVLSELPRLFDTVRELAENGSTFGTSVPGGDAVGNSPSASAGV